MKISKIDSHQHFWKYSTVSHSWISDEMSTLKKDYLPEDLKVCLKGIDFDGCVAVQADQSEEETEFLIELANDNPFIKGVVGWIDFRADDIESRLKYFKQFPIVKGFRHVVQDELDDEFLLGEKFMRGISLLAKYGFTYDILILAKHLKVANEFVTHFPTCPFVIDHIAKPDIKSQNIKEWRDDIFEISKHENVLCKLSGMVTEADWKDWTDVQILPYVDTILEAFGWERVMIGSDWPVCTLAGSYQKVMNVVMNRIESLPEEQQEAILGGNAMNFYNLNND
ncbi:amidohydrolase family protein [Halosquirtibacter laminarini]|uniref:Amidohydrolase family protein n=1 Tax=Halosquirtibacter laminarini TaxID=3374600 RepID=A0AC61NG49_9BACT|nr:amidohydrolase family protein [Prolixibacteraceae bacterium]